MEQHEDTSPSNISPPGSGQRIGIGRALIRLARPRQWVKNVLVVAAPGAAGVLSDREPLIDTIVAFAAFSLASSGTYFLNDAFDVASDRAHPTKRFRPVAAGEVTPTASIGIGILLVAFGIGLGFVATWHLAIVLAGYVAMTTAYSARLKDVAVVDIVIVASGFVLRAIGGAVATGVPISNWFFIVASFGALFMVAGKRHAERVHLGESSSDIRPSLGAYTWTYLHYLRSVSSGATMVAYSLFAFEKSDLVGGGFPWFQVSILPFVMGVLRYALLLDQGKGASPEDLILDDRPLLVIGVLWALTFAGGIYLT